MNGLSIDPSVWGNSLATSMAAVLGNPASTGPAVDHARDAVLGMRWADKISRFRSAKMPWIAAQYYFASPKIPEATILSPFAWAWLVQRKWGPVSPSWIQKIAGHEGYRGLLAPGGVDVFTSVVSVWERNLLKLVTEGSVYLLVDLKKATAGASLPSGGSLIDIRIPTSYGVNNSAMWVVSVVTSGWANIAIQSGVSFEVLEEVFATTLDEALNKLGKVNLDVGRSMLVLAAMGNEPQGGSMPRLDAELILGVASSWLNAPPE